ncbi:MAG: hypothetical protein QM802_17390 [Agriterribacter sp.]
MKRIVAHLIIFSVLFSFCQAQNLDSIYAFMNKDLPALGLGKSNWGMFYIDSPYPIDSGICHKIIEKDWEEDEEALQKEFFNTCINLDYQWQTNFKWDQYRFN